MRLALNIVVDFLPVDIFELNVWIYCMVILDRSGDSMGIEEK